MDGKNIFCSKDGLASSVMAQSLKYAEENNLRPAVSYLSYYTVMHALRTILLTSPQVKWNNGEILQTTHTKTINIACDALAHFNKELASQVKSSTIHLKAFRAYFLPRTIEWRQLRETRL
jgi:cellobiose-specific phosphotransferase system component IIB